MTLVQSLVSSISTKLGFGTTPKARPHPLDPLSPAEISLAVEAIKSHIAKERSGVYRIWYKTIGLVETPKAILAPYLDRWHAAKETGEDIEILDRKAEAIVGVKQDGQCTWYGEYTHWRIDPSLTSRGHHRLYIRWTHCRIHPRSRRPQCLPRYGRNGRS